MDPPAMLKYSNHFHIKKWKCFFKLMLDTCLEQNFVLNYLLFMVHLICLNFRYTHYVDILTAEETEEVMRENKIREKVKVNTVLA